MRRALVLAVLLGCAPDSPGEVTGTSDDDDTGAATTTDESVPEPAFINPAAGEFVVDTNQTVPEPFQIQRVLPGSTQVLLDGASLGALAPGDPFGSLGDEDLELTLHGGMVAARHSLQLVNPGPDGPRRSVTLTMVIAAPAPATRPTWRAELADTTVVGGLALISGGAGPGRVLGVLTPGDPDPYVQLMRAAADGPGWTVDAPIVVPLDGHVPEVMSPTPAVTAVAFSDDGGQPKRMRVAWRVGLPGAEIAARDIVINPSAIVLNTFPAFDLDAALAGDAVEWAAFGRPFAVGHTLLAELVAAADTEVPHPGDRRVVASFWRGDDLRWTPPQRVGTPAPTDLDALGPAAVVPDLPQGRAAAVSVRLGGVHPGLLEVRDDGAVAVTTPARTTPLAVTGDLDLATIVGSFGGRTVAAVADDGRVGLSLLHASGDNSPDDISPRADDLPEAAPTGPPALGLALGFTFFAIPYGDAAPVQVLLCDGEAQQLAPLEQPEPVHCDQLALATTLDGNDPGDPALAFACLSHGALRVGRLLAVPPA